MRNNFKQHALSPALFAAFALGGAMFGANSYAAVSTDAFAVSATVTASCTVSGTDLGFGSFDALGGNKDATSTLTATCTNGSAYTIALNAGTAAGATVTTRQLTHGVTTGEKLNYALFSDLARTVNWGSTIATDTVGGTGSGVAQDITVYGRIPTGQATAIAGTYSDTITATIDF